MQTTNTLDYLISQGFSNTILERFWAKVITGDRCWEWSAFTNYGYGIIGVGPRGAGNVKAHRLSWVIHNGPIPDGLWVLHSCDNPPCTRPDHLFLGTHDDNMRDCLIKQRRHSGNRKLAWEDVLKIKSLEGSMYQREIAERFNTDQGCISLILNGKTYKHP